MVTSKECDSTPGWWGLNTATRRRVVRCLFNYRWPRTGPFGESTDGQKPPSARVRVSYKIENERIQYNPRCQKCIKHGDFTVTVEVCLRAVPTQTLAGGAECQ